MFSWDFHAQLSPVFSQNGGRKIIINKEREKKKKPCQFRKRKNDEMDENDQTASSWQQVHRHHSFQPSPNKPYGPAQR